MNCFISIGTFNTNYFIYCTLITILELYINFGFSKINEKILDKHQIFDIFCYYFGYLLNIIPTWLVKENIIDNNPDNKHMSAKDIIKFFSICLILLLIQFIEIFSNIKDDDDNDNEDNQKEGYEGNYLFFLVLIMFIFLNCFKTTTFYKHQKISFFTFFIIELIKTIYFLIKINYSEIYVYLIIIISYIFYSLLLSIYYIYIDNLMKHKYISPYKCSFMIGAGFVPLIIIVYLFISFTYDFDNIFDLFESFKNLEAINYISLISYPFASGILGLLIFKVINDFSLFHLYIPFILENFLAEILGCEHKFNIIFFLISSFLIELIMKLVFLEVIEIKICGLNKNLKRNIELRALHDSFSMNEDECAQLDENNIDKNIN